MHPALKILIGALMITIGTGLSLGPFSTDVINLIQGGIGPVLILIGAFLVWLESDEWKMRREEKKTESGNREINGLQEQLQNAQSMRKSQTQKRQQANQVQRDYSEILSGTVEEAKDKISQMDNPNYDALIASERGDKGRKTLIQWLERQK